MSKLSNDEISTIIRGQHVGIIVLMPGSQVVCPGNAIVVQQQKVQFSFGGCSKCAVHALRACIQNNPDFAALLLAAIDPNYIP